ncbi:galactosyl transferase GMA12/MNN10 family-domain-containing protein [Pseudomassariella vexata]|uniref:Galactosyl transferase GMA12/MNN10 family-domain-containing protein n=1 Tax=Pseudomassariella vexata TaxID=1141098 RepID=A0A1Y2DA21_9PEZI|nr:galactosyl transferase GMA12/MNN10 family-domain-containing protein [Pseudomassariella vexata]ORY56113.1 galactosyl transferase GMA12/MNN10 family-domain-containing protein [Pseudomassariella vexata]
MHFAYPPRKKSGPPPYLPRSTRIPTLRKSRLKTIAITCVAILFVIWLFSGSSSTKSSTRSSSRHVITGEPPVVIVTVFDSKSVKGDSDYNYIKDVMENRVAYAEKHGKCPLPLKEPLDAGINVDKIGYKTHLVEFTDYELNDTPRSWAKVVAVRHAMAKFPDCRYLWFLEQNALIMNPNLKIEDHVFAASKLEANMIKDLPVVPPDSIIKTFSHLTADDVELVVTQDKEGLSTGSFLIRNGEWAKFFLDTWFDPLYRSYNFQRAETHALEHIVQWHPTILSKLAVIPQDLINSYGTATKGKAYENGDLAIRFAGCTRSSSSGCAEQAKPYQSKWRETFA